MIDYQDIFGRQLKRAMEIREVDIKEVSKRTGIPAKTLYFYWCGDRAPSYHNLVAIGKALHVTLDDSYIGYLYCAELTKCKSYRLSDDYKKGGKFYESRKVNRNADD